MNRYYTISLWICLLFISVALLSSTAKERVEDNAVKEKLDVIKEDRKNKVELMNKKPEMKQGEETAWFDWGLSKKTLSGIGAIVFLFMVGWNNHNNNK